MTASSETAAGRRFGCLLVLGDGTRERRGETFWRVRCENCGTEKEMERVNARRAMSCGCISRHGFAVEGAKHPLYGTWLRMRDRCRNPNHIAYRNYGGRGISVCERWDEFPLFLQDMGEKPGPEYSIDRIDVDGNYEPENCRWATPKQQAQNKRRSRPKRELVEA